MNERTDILEELGVSIYRRDGKWYWTIKSDGFDDPEAALSDAITTFSKEQTKMKVGLDVVDIRPKSPYRAIVPCIVCD